MKVQFGAKQYDVQPQRIGRLRRKLGAVVELTGNAAMGETPDDLGGQLYEALKVFVPDLAPEWELLGYMNQQDFDNRADENWTEADYDADADRSPTTAEVEDMLTTIYRVNGAERLVRLLGKFIDQKTIQRQIRVLQSQAVINRAEDSKQSQSLPPQSGESDEPSSSTPPRTADPTSGRTEQPIPA